MVPDICQIAIALLFLQLNVRSTNFNLRHLFIQEKLQLGLTVDHAVKLIVHVNSASLHQFSVHIQRFCFRDLRRGVSSVMVRFAVSAAGS